MANRKPILVYEFDKLKVGNTEKSISLSDLKILQNHYGDKGVPYYTLIHNGIRFNNYVGVIQINDITIEVLPKVDKLENENWKSILINLLHFTGEIDVDATEFSNLKMNKYSLLELYFSIFIKECEYLLQRGLVKKYRKNEGNLSALKGALHFSKNITQNLIHAERFYTKHAVYDKEHLQHQILMEAMYVVQKISSSSDTHSSISKLILNFPEQKRLLVTEDTFAKIKFDRKTEPYKKAINIAQMILLNYHPDISEGKNAVLALFFDMNLLWEKYIAKILRLYLNADFDIEVQNKKLFWKSNYTPNANLKPDILILQNGKVIAILDTKWKLPFDNRPSDDDLKQMFSYNKIFEGTQSWLVYPNEKNIRKEGMFIDNHGACGMLLVSVIENGILNHRLLGINLLNDMGF